MSVIKPNLDLVNINAKAQNLVEIYHFVLKILSENKILTSIKGHNILRKLTCNNPNLDFADISEYAKFGQGKKISNDQELNSTHAILWYWAETKFWLQLRNIKGHNYKLTKTDTYDTNLDLVDINAYAKFGQILSIHYQDIERKRKVLWTK